MRGVFNRKMNTFLVPFFMNTVLGPFFMQLCFQNWSYPCPFYRCCQNLRHSVARATMSFMMIFPQTCPVTPFLWWLGILSGFIIHPASYPFGTDSSLSGCKVTLEVQSLCLYSGCISKGTVPPRSLLDLPSTRPQLRRKKRNTPFHNTNFNLDTSHQTLSCL